MKASELQKCINAKIKQTTNFDEDVQEMAVIDLTEIVQRDSPSISEEKMTQVVDSILLHIDNKNNKGNSLSSNAIKSLVKIISYLSTDLCKMVVGRLIKGIMNPSTSMADVYGNGLVTIIKEVDYRFGYQLKDLVAMTIEAIKEVKSISEPKTQQMKNQKQLLLINVAEAFIGKWPKIIETVAFNKEEFVQYLLQNLNNPKLSKRSYLCLGALARSLNSLQLRTLVCGNDGLIRKVKQLNNPDKSKEYLYALAAILRSKNPSLGDSVLEVYQFLVEQTKVIMNSPEIAQELENTDFASKLISSNLTGIYSLVNAFEQKFRNIKEGALVNLARTLKQLIVFSPLMDIAYLHNPDQQDEQYDQEGLQSDTSFLVRKSGLELVGKLSSINPALCGMFADYPELHESLKQENQSVRFASFSMFQGLFAGISTDENPIEMELELPGLRRQISAFKQKNPCLLHKVLEKILELTKLRKIDQATKIACYKLLREIPKTFKSTLNNNPELVETTYKIVLAQFKKSKVTDILVLLGNTMEYLSCYPNSQYSLQSLQAILQLIPHVKNQGLLQSLFMALAGHLCLSLAVVVANPSIIQLILTQSIKHSASKFQQATRVSINHTILVLLNHYHNHIREDQLISLLKIVDQKLTSETNKLSFLNGIRAFPHKFTKSPQIAQVLTNIILSISGHLINNKIAAFKQAAQDSILVLLIILGRDFSVSQAKTLLANSMGLIDSREFPEYLTLLSKLYPEIFSSLLARLLSLQDVSPGVVKDIILANNLSPQQVIQEVKTNLNTSNFFFCVDILHQLNIQAHQFVGQVQDSIWGSLCLRLIGLSKRENYFQFLFENCTGSFSTVTKESARYAVGDLCASFVDHLLPKLLVQIELTKQDEMDLKFISFQQCVSRASKESYYMVQPAVKHLLSMVDCNRISNQSIVNRISTCVTNLYKADMQKTLSLLMELSDSKNENLRYVFAYSVGEMDTTNFNNQLVARVITLFETGTLKVKTAAAKSIKQIFNNNSLQMRQFATQALFRLVNQASLFDKNLVIQETIGCKVIVDTGEPLRMQAFSIIEIIVQRHLWQGINYVNVIRMALELIETDPSENVLIHRLDLIKLVSQASKALIQFQGELVDKLSFRNGVLRTYVNEVNDQMSRKVGVNILRKVCEICANCQKENSLVLENFHMQLKNLPLLQHQKENSSSQ